MCPYFQGKEQWTLLLCDVQSANRWLCCDCSLLSESLEDPGMRPQGGSQYMV